MSTRRRGKPSRTGSIGSSAAMNFNMWPPARCVAFVLLAAHYLCVLAIDNQIKIWTPVADLALTRAQPNPEHYLAIGRALRPFPRSKRSRPVSRHSAFQFGPSTLSVRICCCQLWSAPARNDRHLLSPLHPFPTSSSGFPWQPSPCPAHYSQAFGYYAASALRSACWHFRTPYGSSGVGVPFFQSKMCSSTP